MKTIRMFRSFDYKPQPTITVAYIKGVVYDRVPEAAVAAILRAKAGEIVYDGETVEIIAQ